MQKETFIKQYAVGLNPQQLAAVQAVHGPVLLLAVPGSGKTTVLVTRLGYMVLCCDVPPVQILTMTYTVAATHEMRGRFAARFGAELAGQMTFRTINGLSAVILQYYSRVYGRRQPELLTNEGDITRMLTDIWQQVNREFPTESTLKELRTAITYIKNMALTDEEIEGLETDLASLPELYRRYQAALKRAGQMDYDDQMVFALQILRAAPPVLAYFQQRYKYFCVDESQDTSKIQHEIIRLLAGRSLNLFMVGDEDQSIYGFRAAYPQALMDFEQVYPGAQVLLMEENYRSSEEIVAAANAFVARSRYRRPKTLRATQGAQCPIEIRHITRREEQIDWLFEEARRGGGETAVLFRNNESALPLVDLCERRGVPYRFKKADLTFFTHKIVLDAVDFLRFAYEPANGERFLRLYYKFGLALSRQRALAACGASARTGRPILEELIRDSETKTRMRESLGDIYAAFKRIPQLNAADALDAVRHGCGYGAYLNQKGMDTGKLAILEMLAEQEPNALRLLDRLEELRMLIAAKADVNSDVPFVLSTIHSSKGLEYDRVVLLDAFDGVLPAKPEICCRTPEDTRQYEEDRRLFYVAMTRARHKLVLFDCKTMPSVFVQEVIFNLPESRAERELAKAETNRVLRRNKPAAAGPALPPVDAAAVTRVGAAVQHAVFGRGVVTEFDGRFVTVEFSGMRVKKLDAALVAEKHLLWDL
ncbi:ATP-dependent helicase [uncultured Gemmiger sp.]|uniref:ATP-dependent helicase n=1 Tax=uncultured Gemmiger sp. TaxID=1623490 RepID=UPI0025FADABD|nr:ATP-dependent helicase [uncultured Gemmiger sp.]